jgi:hypothetical protein
MVGEVLQGDVPVVRERRTSRTMPGGITRHLKHTLIRTFVFEDVEARD